MARFMFVGCRADVGAWISGMTRFTAGRTVLIR